MQLLKVVRLVGIPAPSVAHWSFSSQDPKKHLEWYKYIDKDNNTCVPLSRLLLTYQALRGIWNRLESGYILLTRGTTSKIGKDTPSPPTHW